MALTPAEAARLMTQLCDFIVDVDEIERANLAFQITLLFKRLAEARKQAKARE